MLLIWDIHLNGRIKDKLLNSLKTFIQEHNEEKNLIFLGDFVYHFSYDRNALLELYDLFLELYTQWKNLYILAWNHDRLWNTFVFEEWRKAFEILSRMKNSDNENMNYKYQQRCINCIRTFYQDFKTFHPNLEQLNYYSLFSN